MNDRRSKSLSVSKYGKLMISTNANLIPFSPVFCCTIFIDAEFGYYLVSVMQSSCLSSSFFFLCLFLCFLGLFHLICTINFSLFFLHLFNLVFLSSPIEHEALPTAPFCGPAVYYVLTTRFEHYNSSLILKRLIHNKVFWQTEILFVTVLEINWGFFIVWVRYVTTALTKLLLLSDVCRF